MTKIELGPRTQEALTKLGEEGFLSPAISEWINRYRLANQGWFSLADELNRVAMRLMPSLTVPENDNAFLAVLLFLRGDFPPMRLMLRSPR